MPDTDAPVRIPPAGTIWRNIDTGAHYTLYDVTNLLEGNPKYQREVVYLDLAGQSFSRRLDGWYESYEEVTGLNHQEQVELANLAAAVQGLKEQLQMRARQAIADMQSRAKAPRPAPVSDFADRVEALAKEAGLFEVTSRRDAGSIEGVEISARAEDGRQHHHFVSERDIVDRAATPERVFEILKEIMGHG